MHIAIIMDGNGRWAKKSNRPRSFGHIRGSMKVKDIVSYCCEDKNITELTLYTFSLENWKRPSDEIQILMRLLEKYIKKEQKNFIKNSIQFKLIGKKTSLKEELKNMINSCEELTKNGKNLKLNIAFNYGAKDEIVRAANSIKGNITEETLTKALDIKENVDLLIRTGKYKRISNFLLWQISYAELFFTDTLWPNFTVSELKGIVDDFKKIKRNFGSISD